MAIDDLDKLAALVERQRDQFYHHQVI